MQLFIIILVKYTLIQPVFAFVIFCRKISIKTCAFFRLLTKKGGKGENNIVSFKQVPFKRYAFGGEKIKHFDYKCFISFLC